MGRIGPLSSTHPPGGVGYMWRGLLPHLEIERQGDMSLGACLGGGLVGLDGVARLGNTVGAGEVVEEREHIVGEGRRP